MVRDCASVIAPRLTMMPDKVVALVGFKGSGKNTAAQALIDDGWIGLSFGNALKDVLASLFGWSRVMLEGDTLESREWRERIDHWWSEKLGIDVFTPRWAMQNVGTEVFRKHFHYDVWVLAVEHAISKLPAGSRVVLLDARFPNEIDFARKLGATVIRIKRGADPDWMDTAALANAGDEHCEKRMRDHWGIHQSEYAWISIDFGHVIENDGSVGDMHQKMRQLISAS